MIPVGTAPHNLVLWIVEKVLVLFQNKTHFAVLHFEKRRPLSITSSELVLHIFKLSYKLKLFPIDGLLVDTASEQIAFCFYVCILVLE